MNILSSNNKTGYSTNMPIEQTCLKDCPFYVDKSCYGMRKGHPATWASSVTANDLRLDLYLTDPQSYFDRLRTEIVSRKLTHLRVNGIGDLPDIDYARLMARLARTLPSVKLWIATRKKTICEAIVWPDNVIVRYSDGIQGEHTSEVVLREDQASCPATRSDSGIHNCSQCGWKCFDKDIPNVSFLKH